MLNLILLYSSVYSCLIKFSDFHEALSSDYINKLMTLFFQVGCECGKMCRGKNTGGFRMKKQIMMLLL